MTARICVSTWRMTVKQQPVRPLERLCARATAKSSKFTRINRALSSSTRIRNADYAETYKSLKDGLPPAVLEDQLANPLQETEVFLERHIGPAHPDVEAMLKQLDPPVKNLEDFIAQSIPENIRAKKELKLDNDAQPRFGKSEAQVHNEMITKAKANKTPISLFGEGYYGTRVPAVIQRNVLENPAWYTSYTPYQAEISQGRLESLLNFQTMVTDLTGLTIANASVLDEATAAAEAMTMSMNIIPASRMKSKNKTFVVSNTCNTQTIAVLESRANGFGINIVVGDVLADDCKLVKDQGDNLIGVLVQYPDTFGGVHNYQALSDMVHKAKATLSVATDLLALTHLKPPGEFGADIAFGSAQRLGVPMGAGGPHAAFFACSDQHKRKIPGRLVGVSKDRLGNQALRLALQTREQHIRREKATSNICTAQALLANMASLYAVYHGPKGLTAIAQRIWMFARLAQQSLTAAGHKIVTNGAGANDQVLFDTLILQLKSQQEFNNVRKRLNRAGFFVRHLPSNKLAFAFGEDIDLPQLRKLLRVFGAELKDEDIASLNSQETYRQAIPEALRRTSTFLTHPVFNTHHSETELLRYIHHLASKDLSLVHSMIPLGSCTMKLNATTEMVPITQSNWANIHPFAPLDSIKGYLTLVDNLSGHLVKITGMDHVSLQPNSGAQGEFAGLRVIKKFHESKADGKVRDICLIPVSAHGTNPASAAMTGMKVVTIKCDTKTGNLDIKDLEEKCKKYENSLAAIMVTYPSTFGVFEPEIKRVCELVHEHGGQVYMDGANLNAQIGLCSPGEIGADVCHLNLHKTFCIPHGGGGPGVGPIAVKEHLSPYLPSHPRRDPQMARQYLDILNATKEDKSQGESTDSAAKEEKVQTESKGSAATADQVKQLKREGAIAPISAAPWGSALILPISQAYIQMMGGAGLTYQTKIALLNANYIMSRLKDHYPIVYTNANGRCAHEFILDARVFKESCGVEAIDIAKRLQDYGFHAPTMSWPVANTLMIEPTESESKEELDRFCDAFISIRQEIRDIEEGKVPRDNNLLKLSPHPQQDLLREDWDRPYTREQAAYPLPYLREKKFWPSVARVDDAYGDTNLFCTCTPVEEFKDEDGITGHQAPTPT